MRPVIKPVQMAAIDAASTVGIPELIRRAGWLVAHHARQMMEGTYGRRVVVLVGPGNNGADGERAADVLSQWGVRCEVIHVVNLADEIDHGLADTLSTSDLLVDAAFGTGFRDSFSVPVHQGNIPPVLAVDIPSGIDGLTGTANGEPLRAARTVTFGAVKPGLLLGDGPAFAGEVVVENLGLDCSSAATHWVDESDVRRLWPRRDPDAHKWRQAVWVIGGSQGMTGAVTLAASGAFRAGAGYVAVSVPQGDIPRTPIEAVGRPLTGNWGVDVTSEGRRFGAMVIGPGLDSTDGVVRSETARVLAEAPAPLVVDAGALPLIAEAPDLVRSRSGPTVLTPHDGEFERLMGRPPGNDRMEATLAAAVRFNCVVLLKGPTTVVASPDGRLLLSTAGDERLATAGTGDVLCGVIAAGLAGGLDPLGAAAVGSELHGLSVAGSAAGLTAGDLPKLIASTLAG